MISKVLSGVVFLLILTSVGKVFGFPQEPIRKLDTARAYFEIQVIDSETKRGVPMVKLTAVDQSVFWTDSAGRVAINEPSFFGKRVYFHVEGHGYEFPADGFGFRGVTVTPARGKTKTIKVQRKNIAQRIYRITGRGIYRDSVLLGKVKPEEVPGLNGLVVGQDTVQVAKYKKKLYWAWGDTNRLRYPLGQFKTSGATSALPLGGAYEVDRGIELKYFVDKEGFSRQMIPIEGKGAVWLHGLTTVKDRNHGEMMFGHFVRLLNLENKEEHGLVRYNNQTHTFEKWTTFEKDAKLFPQGVSLYHEKRKDSYIYFCRPFPFIRVKDKAEFITKSKEYEAYTCLKPGKRFREGVDLVDRDKNGNVVWGWKRNTDFLGPERIHSLIENGFLKRSEARLILKEGPSKEFIYLKGGSVHWNDYRNRWVMIGTQIGGKSSYYGELWYAEADRLEGPWLNPRHIVSHNQYSFYNPSHHPFFDQQNGRVIYFEGTMATTFSKAKVKIPRYDYNQIMYKLDLGGKRMNLPKLGNQSRKE